MVFSSLSFLCIFLPAVLVLYRLMPGLRAKNVLLMVASLVFYAYGEPVYVLLMIASAAFNYLWALLLGDGSGGGSGTASSSAADAGANVGPTPASRARRRVVMACAVVQNLGVLCVFKYAGFLVESLNALTGLELPVPQIALPIGISFFTFQAMSYVIDVYRSEVEPQRNFVRILLYISLFPQLIAGPIVKYHDVAEELGSREQTLDGFMRGLRRFIIGLAKKVLIANYMAVVADTMFAAPASEVNAVGAWMGVGAYMLQIYFDFSGYSDMAIGLGWMFGFHFKENFNYPYVATSVKEFWRRWHISLSTWFRDYLYIPLGGNRRGRARAAANRIIVFFLCGLWHGASWTFVFWGLYHGAFLLLEQYVPFFSRGSGTGENASRARRAFGHVYLILVVLIGWVFFRADTIDQGFFWVATMFTGWTFDPVQVALVMSLLTPLNIVVFAVGCVTSLPVLDRLRGRFALERASWAVALVLLALCLLSLATGTYNPFIYFRF